MLLLLLQVLELASVAYRDRMAVAIVGPANMLVQVCRMCFSDCYCGTCNLQQEFLGAQVVPVWKIQEGPVICCYLSNTVFRWHGNL